MKFKIDNKGLSLPLTIGLLLLLVSITTTVNELVIRALRASHQIEASDKAYFAAEAGVEDALYELSVHTAGYETSSLGDSEVRNDNFSQTTIKWQNEWEIKNKGLNTCTNSLSIWQPPFPTFCGQLYEGQKLVINLFNDDATSLGITTGEINETPEDINTMNINNIEVKFRLPIKLVTDNPGAFSSGLLIDNDGDLGTSSQSGPNGILGLNEDGASGFGYPPNTCPYSGGISVDDNDCDNLEDEDGPEDPVILWKLVDGSGHSFQPLRGCKGDSQHSSHPGQPNAILCEKNFSLPNNNEVSASLTETDWGLNEKNELNTLQSFLTSYAGKHETLQMEILIASPMEAVNVTNASKITIPYLEYGIYYNELGGKKLPSTFFAIKSDGYFQDSKQSITTNVVPQATTRLLDLTIIQQ